MEIVKISYGAKEIFKRVLRLHSYREKAGLPKANVLKTGLDRLERAAAQGVRRLDYHEFLLIDNET